MAITISNLRISPYSQKDEISKIVFGDEWSITVKLPTPHQTGDKYAIGIDYENTLYPPNRPLCAGTEAFVLNGDELTFSVKLGTARLRDWLSMLKKPTPIAIQIVRIRNNKAETLLLDTILALPSVFDGVVTVCEGDAIQVLLDAKLDKPAIDGTEGQILSIDENGQLVWRNQTQADYDESDSTADSYIKNKPVISEVGHTGSYNDLLDKPDLSIYVEKEDGKGLSTNDFTDADVTKLGGIEDGAEVNVQADYDESDSTADSYIRHKPVISTVGHTGSYTDLLNKPDLSVYSLITETGNKLSMSIDSDYVLTVGLLDKNDTTLDTKTIDLPLESMIVNASYSNGVLTLTLQNGNTVDVDISDIVSGLVPDSRTINGHALDADVTITASDLGLATVATTGDYDDLINKPVVEQTDWDESDSDSPAFLKNKPETIKNYFTVKSDSNGSTVQFLYKDNIDINLEYSTDNGATWTTINFDHENPVNSPVWTINNGQKVKFRGNNPRIGNGIFTSGDEIDTQCRFVFTGSVKLSGMLTSLLDKSCTSNTTIDNGYPDQQCFQSLFACLDTETQYNQTPIDASKLVFPDSWTENGLYTTFKGLHGLTALPPVFEYGAGMYLRGTFENTGITGKVTIPYFNSLYQYCFTESFKDCTGITSAEIMCSNPGQTSFLGVFNGCSNLHEVTVHFTSWKDENNNDVWMWTNAPATGVWRCQKALDTTVRGANGIPNGWTIEYIDEQPIQSDWDESDSTDVSFILNKPTIPSTSDINALIAEALTFHNN